MASDPAVLFYIDKWLTATKTMQADTKGWYLNLILFQYKLGSLPNDIEELANICEVRHSEFERFKQVFEQVLKHKFEQNEEQRLENSFASQILQKRKNFVEKKSKAGKIGYFAKFLKANITKDEKEIDYLKESVDIDEISYENQTELKQMLKQMLEQKNKLLINVNVNINKIKERYNEICINLPKVINIHNTRKIHVNARLREHGEEAMYKVFTMANESSFLTGENDRKWKANFDWIMNPVNFTKILEGNYSDRNIAKTNATLEKMKSYD